MKDIHFVPLEESHIPLIHHWFNQSHVQSFYSLRVWTLDEVLKKLTPHLKQEKGYRSYLIYMDKEPIGYIQSYPIREHPWENQDLPEEIVQDAAGIDLFIGEEKYLHKGFGVQILERFLKEHIWLYYRYCLADPNIHNQPSLRLFEKCGFKKHKIIETQDALKRSVKLQLYIKKTPFSKD